MRSTGLLCMIVFVSAFLLPSCAAEDTSRLCSKRLDSIGRTLTQAYTPEELATLFGQENPWQAVVADWESRKHRPRSDLPRDLCGCPAANDVPYVLNTRLAIALRKGLSPSAIPLMWDAPGHHGNRVPVYFLDGLTATLETAELRKTLEQAGAAGSGE